MTVPQPQRVLVTLNLDDAALDRIREAAGGARIDLLDRDGRRLFYGAPIDDAEARARAGTAVSGLLAAADVVFATTNDAIDLNERAPNLRWLMVANAGIDRLVERGQLTDRFLITNNSGVSALTMGEWVMAAIFAFAKGFPQLARAQQQRVWTRAMPAVLAGQTCGVVGMGAIGSEAARLARANGMRVLATRRSVAEPTEAGGLTLLPAAQLPRLLEASDYVVIATPLTPETAGLIGAGELARMKPAAVLVNVARGPVVDEAALIEALREGRIAGAALDVFEQEPLPAESPLWEMANVLVSPHVSGNTPDYYGGAVDIFVENLRRFRAGEPLRNLCEPERGY